jgi:transposase
MICYSVKGLERVETEMSLHVLAHNVKWLMSLLGVAGLMEAIRAYALLLALQRVFRAITLLIRSISQKMRRHSLSTL